MRKRQSCLLFFGFILYSVKVCRRVASARQPRGGQGVAAWLANQSQAREDGTATSEGETRPDLNGLRFSGSSAHVLVHGYISVDMLTEDGGYCPKTADLCPCERLYGSAREKQKKEEEKLI